MMLNLFKIRRLKQKAAERARRELIEKSGLFDRDWYLANNPDIVRSGKDPLTHLVEHGVNEWRNPGPGFEAVYYAAQNPSYIKTGLSPLEHFLRIGRTAGAAAMPPLLRTAFADLVAESGLFDDQWYLERNGDVRRSKVDPFNHFTTTGAKEWRDPGPGFETKFYAKQVQSLGETGLSPFEHYLSIGRTAGFSANRKEKAEKEFRALLEESGLFDEEWYLSRNADVRKSGMDPLTHIVRLGANEFRDPSPEFETASYVETNPEFPADGSISPLEHYLRLGLAAGASGKAPTYAEWAARFDSLNTQEKAWIESDARAWSLPGAIHLHVLGREAGSLKDVSQATEAQVGVRPSLRFIGRSEGCVDPERALNECDDGAVAILSAGEALLRPHAAYAFAMALVRGEADAAYSDHDHRDRAGVRVRPVFKPAMSPVFMRSLPYAGPVVAVRIGARNRQKVLRALAAALDDDPIVAFADLLLDIDWRRVSRVPMNLFYLPLVDHATTKDTEWSSEVVPDRRVPELALVDLSDPPQVHILIPTRDRRELLEACVESILTTTNYPRDRFQIIVIDNDSRDTDSLEYLSHLNDHLNCKVVASPGPFNFAKICNTGAAAADADVLVFLNNDMTVIEDGWLTMLVSNAVQSEIGAVGAKLLFPDDTIQHGGVVLGALGVAAHRLVGRSVEQVEDFDVTREMTTITGACLAIRREVFEEVGAFDPALAVAFNDTDLCMRCYKAGYRNIYIARALLYHHESKSRGYDDTPEKRTLNHREAIYTRSLHNALFRDDPSYNPNLSLQKIGDLGMPPRIMAPWRRSGERRRILLLSAAHGLGHGVGYVVAMQAAQLLSRGWDVTIGGPVGKRDRNYPGCSRVHLVTPMQAAAHAVAGGFDCVIAHTPPFYSMSLFLGHRPMLYIYDHGEPPPALFDDREQREAIDWQKRFCAAQARRIFVISQAIYDEQFSKDAIVLRNGNTHLSAWSPQWAVQRAQLRKNFGFEGRFVVLKVCRFHERERYYKGVDLFAKLLDELPYTVRALAGKVTFALAGRGDEADITYARKAGLAVFPNVTEDEMAELYAASDLYVSLSKWEGYNLGIGQALAMGLPVIASDIPAHREFGVPTSSTIPKLCALVSDIFSRWDEMATGRTARLEPWDIPLSRMVDILEEDVDADLAGPWL